MKQTFQNRSAYISYGAKRNWVHLPLIASANGCVLVHLCVCVLSRLCEASSVASQHPEPFASTFRPVKLHLEGF